MENTKQNSILRAKRPRAAINYGMRICGSGDEAARGSLPALPSSLYKSQVSSPKLQAASSKPQASSDKRAGGPPPAGGGEQAPSPSGGGK